MAYTGTPPMTEEAEPLGSFADWVAPHLHPMHRLASRLAPGAAEDVVQEALVRAWRRRSTYDPARGTPSTWLLAIVAGEARRHRSRLVVTTARPDPSTPALGADTDHDLAVQLAVADLPPRMRLAVELHYFVGLTVAETAQVLGVADGTVKSALHDARTRLRGVLEPGGEG